MLVEFYLFIWGVAFFCLIAGFKFNPHHIFAIIATMFFFILSISSAEVDKVYCEMNATNTILCRTYSISSTPLMWLNVGFGMIGMVFLIVYALLEFKKPKERRIYRRLKEEEEI